MPEEQAISRKYHSVSQIPFVFLHVLKAPKAKQLMPFSWATGKALPMKSESFM